MAFISYFGTYSIYLYKLRLEIICDCGNPVGLVYTVKRAANEMPL
jgi:hypothetical protein